MLYVVVVLDAVTRIWNLLGANDKKSGKKPCTEATSRPIVSSFFPQFCVRQNSLAHAIA